MKVGSLFSGIGGFDIGLERAGMQIEWQVENNDYCRRVIQKHWPKVPCHYDITTIDWRFIQPVDLICGGFPCQPFSLAGKRRGKGDDRYLWPEVVRCLDTLRPTWFLGENVPGLINLALDQVCTDLESLGYTVWPVCVPACAVDAPHIRQRIWIMAHTNAGRLSGQRVCKEQPRGAEIISSGEVREGCAIPIASRELPHGSRPCSARGDEPTDSGGNVADAISDHNGRTNGVRRRKRKQKETQGAWPRENGYWSPEPNVGRVAHGVPARVDRLRGLGNAIVPQIAEALGKMIMDASQ